VEIYPKRIILFALAAHYHATLL